jgi:thiamine-phosphate diphosphorylase
MLHVLTSDDIVARDDFLQHAESLLRILGPRGALHVRTRRLPAGRYVQLVRRLAPVADESGAALIVNERVDVALAGGAGGVQLGRGALLASDVQRIAPQLAIGVSVHTADEARQAGNVAWVMAGHVFETASHPGVTERGIGFLRTVISAAQAPVIAVGGITPGDVAAILAAGAVGAAVISGIWGEREPDVAAIRYLSQYDNGTVGGDVLPHG